MIEQLHLYLILVGCTIAAVVGALWIKARRASTLNLALIRLNEQHQFDVPAFLEQAWKVLDKSGLFGIDWRLDWFGVRKAGQSGVARGAATRRELAIGEMHVTVDFYRSDGRGEQRYFEEGLIETFMLLLRTDMLIKAGATDATLSQMSRLNLFLQHDMKNIAQFIQLMGDQLSAVPAGKEQQVLHYLRSATPLVRHRADRIVRSLTLGAATEDAHSQVLLGPLLEQLCDLYGLPRRIEGNAVVPVDSALETVLDNILKNYHDLGQREHIAALLLEITVASGHDGVAITIRAPGAPHAAALERLFEPFWSSTPAGLGIGLYQARHLMHQQGGSLSVSEDAAHTLCFHLNCPHPARI